ncbi:serine hydrolase domain-containing protein [Kineococcus sp. NUM-3379]
MHRSHPDRTPGGGSTGTAPGGVPVVTRPRTLAVAAALAVAGLFPAVVPAAPPAHAGTPLGAVQAGLDALVREEGFPAALASVRDRHGRVRNLTAGTADLATGAPVPVDGQVRIGSDSKAFTAVVVLQLVGEGRIGLDEPVETYLPGLLRGEGIDGRAITVRHLLQHTSGLPDHTELLGQDWFALRDEWFDPRQLLDLALAQPAHAAPGTRFEYNNTGYLVAGLLVQRVTGRPLAEEVTERGVRRAGLRHTYVPAPGESALRGRHPRGYHATEPGGALRDLTELDPSWAWGAGDLVSTPGDLNRFSTALLGGDLLRPAELAQMRTTIPSPSPSRPGARYGLGLQSLPLSCGGLAWGHGGDIPGYETRGGATDDGRAVTVAVTAIPTALEDPLASATRVLALVDEALCALPAGRS